MKTITKIACLGALVGTLLSCGTTEQSRATITVMPQELAYKPREKYEKHARSDMPMSPARIDAHDSKYYAQMHEYNCDECKYEKHFRQHFLHPSSPARVDAQQK